MRRLFMGNEQDRLMELFNEARAKRSAAERESWRTLAFSTAPAARTNVFARTRKRTPPGAETSASAAVAPP